LLLICQILDGKRWPEEGLQVRKLDVSHVSVHLELVSTMPLVYVEVKEGSAERAGMKGSCRQAHNLRK
jgi:hypothetical protein